MQFFDHSGRLKLPQHYHSCQTDTWFTHYCFPARCDHSSQVASPAPSQCFKPPFTSTLFNLKCWPRVQTFTFLLKWSFQICSGSAQLAKFFLVFEWSISRDILKRLLIFLTLCLLLCLSHRTKPPNFHCLDRCCSGYSKFWWLWNCYWEFYSLTEAVF